MGAHSKRKGDRGEREAAAWFQAQLGGEATRLGFQQREHGRGGERVPDVAVQAGPVLLDVEVKRYGAASGFQWRGALLEAIQNCRPQRLPMVWARMDRGEPVVVMRASDFAHLVAVATGGRAP